MFICAPFAGIVHYHVSPGQKIATGELVASVEAVKLEAPLVAPGPGVVAVVHYEDHVDVSGGDKLLELKEAE
ncbi:biotin/lipoyl-containing protein [Corynebacterium kutscheri]|nr:biotin/lipoyl-containing protein [Corynebacterium kutscheri]